MAREVREEIRQRDFPSDGPPGGNIQPTIVPVGNIQPLVQNVPQLPPGSTSSSGTSATSTLGLGARRISGVLQSNVPGSVPRDVLSNSRPNIAPGVGTRANESYSNIQPMEQEEAPPSNGANLTEPIAGGSVHNEGSISLHSHVPSIGSILSSSYTLGTSGSTTSLSSTSPQSSVGVRNNLPTTSAASQNGNIHPSDESSMLSLREDNKFVQAVSANFSIRGTNPAGLQHIEGEQSILHSNEYSPSRGLMSVRSCMTNVEGAREQSLIDSQSLIIDSRQLHSLTQEAEKLILDISK